MKMKLVNPYPGLRSFTPSESDRFFGRKKQIDELSSKVRKNRFVAVLGASGSGKSSLVRAGVIPQLRGQAQAQLQQQGLSSDATAESWLTGEMTPGQDPIARLAAMLVNINADSLLESGEQATANSEKALNRQFNEQVSMVEAALSRSSLGLVETVRQFNLKRPLLLLVDQFEELFRVNYRGLRDPAASFVKLLRETIAQREIPIYIVITMRTDFLGDCSRLDGLPEAINQSQYLVPRLNRMQLKEIIVGPIESQGLRMSSRLLNQFLNDLKNSNDQLPVLQHALMRTWAQWAATAGEDGKVILDTNHYQSIGTLFDALNNHENLAYKSLTEQQKKIAKALFTCLGDITADNQVVRRIVEFREIVAVAQSDQDDVLAVMDVYRSDEYSFILPRSDKAIVPETLIDISHESVFRVCKRIQQWLREEQDISTDFRRVVDRAKIYFVEKNEELLTGRALENVLEQKVNWPNAAWAERYDGGFDFMSRYVQKSLEKRQADQKIAEQRRLKEENLKKEEKQRERQKMVRQRRALVLAALLLLFVTINLINVNALKNQAESLYLAIESGKQLPDYPELGVLKAMEAIDQQDTHDSQNALNHAFMLAGTRDLFFYPGQDIVSAKMIGEQLILTVDEFGSVELKDLANGKNEILAGGNFATQPKTDRHRVAAARLQGSDQAGLITVAMRSGRLRVYQYSNDYNQAKTQHVQVKELEIELTVQNDPRVANAAITALAISADLQMIATGDTAGQVLALYVEGGKVVKVAKITTHKEAVSSIAFSSEGSLLASGGWHAHIHLCRLSTTTEQDRCKIIEKGVESNVAALAFAPPSLTDPIGNVTQLASGGWNGEVKLWDVETKALIAKHKGDSDQVTSLIYSKDGKHLAVSHMDGKVMLLDNQLLQYNWLTYDNHIEVTDLSFNLANDRLVVAGLGTISLWKFKQLTEVEENTLQKDWNLGPIVSSDGGWVAVVRNKNSIEVFQAQQVIGNDGKKHPAYSADSKRHTFVDDGGFWIQSIAFVEDTDGVSLLTRSSNGKMQKYLLDNSLLLKKSIAILESIQLPEGCSKLLKIDDEKTCRDRLQDIKDNFAEFDNKS